MAKKKAKHVIPGMNVVSATQGNGAGYNEETASEPLSAVEKQYNKKRKKNK